MQPDELTSAYGFVFDCTYTPRMSIDELRSHRHESQLASMQRLAEALAAIAADAASTTLVVGHATIFDGSSPIMPLTCLQPACVR